MEKQMRFIIPSFISLLFLLAYFFFFINNWMSSGGVITLVGISLVALFGVWHSMLFDKTNAELKFQMLFQKYFGSIEIFVLTVFLLSLPFIYVKSLNDGALRSRMYALSILIFLLSASFSIRFFLGSFKLFLSKADKFIFGALALFLILNLVSALQGVSNGKEAVVQVLKECTLIFYLFYTYQVLRNRPQGKNILIKAFILMTLIFLGFAVQQLMQADFTQFREATQYYGYYLRQAVGHVMSTLSSVNPFTSFLFLSLAFSVYGIIKFNWFWKIISIIAAIGAVFFIGLIASKASWGALAIFAFVAIALIYYFILNIRPKITGVSLPMWLHVSLLLLPFLAVTGAVYIVEKTELQIVNVIGDKIQQILKPELCLHHIYSLDNPTSTQTRTLVWANTLEMTRDNPLLGVGPGQWRIEYAKYGLDGFEHDIRNGTKHFQRTHNDFFWIMGETGFTGIFLFIIIYVGILFIAFKSYREKTDLNERLVQGVLFSILLGFILVLFVSFPRERISHNIAYLFMFALVLSAEDKNLKAYNWSKNKFLKIVPVVFVFLFGFNLYVVNDLYKAEQESRKITRNVLRKNYRMVLKSADKIKDSYFTMDNYSTPIYYYVGVAESSLHKDYLKAQKSFHKALELNPHHLQVLNNLAVTYDLTGDKKTALAYFEKALSVSPRYKEAKINKAIVLYNFEKYDEAFELINSIPLNEKNPDKFKETAIKMMRKKMILNVDKVDQNRALDWIKDENKVYDSYVKVRKSKINIDDYLTKEFGK